MSTLNQDNDLFNDGKVRIYRNPSNEITVQDIDSGLEIRLTSFPDKYFGDTGMIFTSNGYVQPSFTAYNIFWTIKPRPNVRNLSNNLPGEIQG